MRWLQKLDESAERVQDMAQKLGHELYRGLSPESSAYRFRSMVTACSACNDPERCDALRAINRSLAKPPGFCRNKSRFRNG